MAKVGGTKAWVATAGVVLLMALVAIPALSGAASAAPATSAASTQLSNQWAYGGQGWSNNTLQYGNVTITWDASFGWTVVFTSTPTGPNTWTIEEQRTVGITVSATYSSPNATVTYHYHGVESDLAFANLTNQSIVYVNGQAVPALGIDNASVSVQGAITQAITKTVEGHTASASLDVTGTAQASTSFSPSLGLIPLNLTGVYQWNSSALATPSASWNVSYTWAEQGYNGTTASGSGSKYGSLTASGTVTVTGFKGVFIEHPPFVDGQQRTSVVLVFQGPFDNFDGFIFVPHDFDLFGSAGHEYDSASFGSADISAETLYVSPGHGGPRVTAALTNFGANDRSMSTLATPTGASGPAASSGSPSAAVLGQPMSVASANAESNCLTNGCGGATAAVGPGGALLVALIGVAVAVVLGTVGVIEWRSYARRRSQTGLVGGYGESWPNGVPPVSAVSAPNMGPSDGARPADDPTRHP